MTAVQIDEMYLDKLDGRISAEFYDRKSTEWRAEQSRLRQCIQQHSNDSRTYVNEGVDLLELVSNAHRLFDAQPAHEKRRLLRFVISNCIWKGGELLAVLRQPFDLIAGLALATRKPAESVGLEICPNKEWLLR